MGLGAAELRYYDVTRYVIGKNKNTRIQNTRYGYLIFIIHGFFFLEAFQLLLLVLLLL